MKRLPQFILVVMAGLAAASPSRVCAQTCYIDAGTDYQTIDGFGFCTTWSPVMTADQAATLFGTGSGQLGFSLLRVYIDETGNFATDAANAAIAHANGATVLGTAWTPPPSMKSNDSSVGGTLNTSQYGAYAAYLANAANAIGLDIVSFQNEPDITVTYQSCSWTPAQMQAWCDAYGSMVGRPIAMPESFHFDDSYSDATLNDPVGVNTITYVAGHLYGGGNTVHSNAISHGKHVWMTEHFNYGQDLGTAMADAKEVSDCMSNQFSAYIWWHAYHPALTTLDLIDGSTPLPNGYAIGQFAHWIRPGQARCASTYNPQPGVYVTAFHRGGLVVVALNMNSSYVNQSFVIQNAQVPSLIPYQTGGPYNRGLTLMDPVPVTNGTFSFSMGPDTVTTFVRYPSAAPVILAQPADKVVFPGSTLSLSVQAAGDADTYQWYLNGVAIPGQTQSTLSITGASAADAGSYTAIVSNPGGTATTRAASVSVEADASRLINESCRAVLGTGQIVTAGFYIGGTGSKQVLIRAAGPALAAFGVPDPMPDPQLKVFQGSTMIAQNDNWDAAAIGDAFARVGAFGFPGGSRDAALLATLESGQSYTVQASGVGGSSGTVLIEVYDADSGPTTSQLANLSVRATVGGVPAANVTVGFVLAGAGQRNLLIRGAGPALVAFGVGDALSDPQLALFDSNSQLLEANYGWTTADSPASLAAAASAAGAFSFAAGSQDTAMLAALSPSMYTAQVTSASDATGEALAEIYAVP